MKYFTYEWWKGCQSLEARATRADPFLDYALHLKRIRKRLTAELLRLEEGLSLHDGLLRVLHVEISSGRVSLAIDLDDWNKLPCGVELLYGGVSIVEATAAIDEGIVGPGGFGHLGYLETDVRDGGFEHRILFSSGIELRIVFSGFHLRFPGDGRPGA